MIDVWVYGISTFVEPTTAASATTWFAKFVASTALGASVAAACRGYTRPCCWLWAHANIITTWNIATSMLHQLAACMYGRNTMYYDNKASSWKIITPVTRFQHILLLQTWIPCAHVWSNFLSPTSPHFLNQEPPGAQQLSLPVFFVVPHLKHMGLTIGITTRGLVPDCTDFGHGSMIQYCTIHVASSEQVSHAHLQTLPIQEHGGRSWASAYS